jgi:hypothetical protein
MTTTLDIAFARADDVADAATRVDARARGRARCLVATCARARARGLRAEHIRALRADE